MDTLKKQVSDLVITNGDIILNKLKELVWGTSLLNEIPILNNILSSLKIYSSYRNLRFCERLEKLLKANSGIDEDEQKKILEKFQTDEEHKTIYKNIINVLESINEEEKVDMAICLFSNFLHDNVDVKEFRLFMHFIDTCFADDLLWLKDFSESQFSSSNLSLQNLLGTCLVEKVDIDIGEFDSEISGDKYKKSDIGNAFCNAVFN